MFKNVFQGGPCVEVFSSQGKDPLGKWKLMGAASIRKVYEKEAKSYVHVLEGATTTTKMQLPKDSKQPLVLIQRYLVMQLFLPLGKDFSVELSVSDMSNNKRRLLFSTAQRDISATPLHAKIPLTILKRAVWLNLCIDMVTIVGEAFRGQTYKSLDTLTISAACHLRKVFTMKCQLSDDTDDDDLYDCKPATNDTELDSLPRNLQFAPDVSYHSQVLTMNKLKHAELKLRGETSRPPSSTETDLSSSMRGKQDNKPMHIAFGSKVPVPSSASGKRITSSVGSREESSSAGSRTSRSSHSRTQKNEDYIVRTKGNCSATGELDTLVVHGHHHARQQSDPGTEIPSGFDRDKETLSGSKTWSPGTGGIAEEISSMKPHPPRQGSGDKSRRVIKIRPSSGKENSTPRSRSSSGTKRGTYDRSRYSATQDQASAETSDAEVIHCGRLPDDVILKSAVARIRNDSLSEDEQIPSKQNRSNAHSARTKPDSNSESEDLLARSIASNGRNGRGKVQRRKKKPERERLDSLSDTEENQAIGQAGNSERVVGNRSETGNDRSTRKGRNGASMAKTDARKSFSDNLKSDSKVADRCSGENRAGDKDCSNKPVAELYNPCQEERCGEKDERDKPQGKIYTFMSPPRNAPLRAVERSLQLDPKKLQMQLEKISMSSQDPDPDSSIQGTSNTARLRADDLEADFLQGNVSAEEEHLQDRDRYQAIMKRTPSPRQSRALVPAQKSALPSDDDGKCCSVKQGPMPARRSPTLRRSKLKGSNLSVEHSKSSRNARISPRSTQLQMMSSPRAVSRCSVSSKKLKEISEDDPRLSVTDDYDWRRYQSCNSSLASSMEATMLASLRRQQLEELFEEECEPKANSSFDIHHYGDDDLSSSSSDDTMATFGTFKPLNLSNKLHRYQDEMHFPANGNPLLQSNPRDWNEPFSPPIVLPSEKLLQEERNSCGMFLGDQQSPSKDAPAGVYELARQKSTSSDEHRRHTESEGHDEDELDLLYDPCLNCYFDPKTGKYYELK